MKDKLQTLFGGFGFVLYFIAIWLLSFYPLLFCEFPWWGDVLYIAVICFFSESLITSILSTVIYIIAFVNALHSPVDFWTIIFFVLFALNALYAGSVLLSSAKRRYS